MESIAYGGGSVSLSLYDIYLTVDNHSEVLKVLEERYNKEMGDSSPIEWFSKIKDLENKGSKSIGNYVSAYAGESAEYKALEMLKSQGFNAELFKSKTHPNDDIRVYTDSGEYIDYSVKSYGDIGNLDKTISEHPSSTHYIVNSEIFNKLQETGKLNKYAEDNITILDGEYSNEAFRNIAKNTFDDLSVAGDVADKIPYIGSAFFGAKIIKNAMVYKQGKQSKYETSINIAGDAINSTLKTSGAVIGCEIGVFVGELLGIDPEINEFISGGIGGIVGAFSVSNITEMFKKKFKWGDITESVEYFGKKFSDFDTNHPYIKHNIYNIDKIKKKLINEKKLLKRYKKQLNPYNDEKITIPAILSLLYVKNLEELLSNTELAAREGHREILDLCGHLAYKTAKSSLFVNSDVIKNRFLGELLLSNRSVLLPSYKLNSKEKLLIDKYDNEIKKSPNHPYIIKIGASKDIVQAIYAQSLNKISNNKIYSFKKVNLNISKFFPNLLILISIILILMGRKTF